MSLSKRSTKKLIRKQNNGASRRTIPAVAFVMQEPRDYRKLSAMADTLDVGDRFYVVDDYYKDGRNAVASLELLTDKGVPCQAASKVLESNSSFVLGVYQANTWRQNTTYARQFLPIWLWRAHQDRRLSWKTARDVLIESSGIVVTLSKFNSRIVGGLFKRVDSLRKRHLGSSDYQRMFDPSKNKESPGQPNPRGAITPRYLRRQVAASAIKQQWREVVLALSQRVLIPVPLARDLTHLSVLAPPYGDDVWASFPEAHIRESFHFYLTATDDDRRRVTQAVGERAETIGYPQYWAAQAIGHPNAELHRHLNLNEGDRVIAWLPGSLNDLAEEIDYLQALTGTFNVVLRPHPDLYLPEREARRQEVHTHAKARGLRVQDSHRMDAGLLVRGADLVIAEGASSLRSSLFLGAQVVIGLNGMKSKHRRAAAETYPCLFNLVTLYRRTLPGDRLVTLLSEATWWKDVATASESVRNALFRSVPAANVGRQRCAAALSGFAVQSGL